MTGSATKEQFIRRHPASWVPTLYFAEGIPFYIVNLLALFFYQDMGIKNAVTTAVISMLALPWTLKPLWSPMLEMYKTKKFFVVGTQMIGGLSLVLLVLSLNMPDFFRYTVAIFALIGFCSATHDIGINFSDRDRTFIHRVDSSIDKERAKVVNDLLFTGMVRSLELVGRPDVPNTIANATGDTLETDGAMAVLLF